MGDKICVQKFLAEWDAERLRFVVDVATDDNALAIGTLEGNGLQTFLQRIESKERAARLHEVGEMLISVVLGRVAVGTVSRTYLHEGILFPAPGTTPLVAKDEVPVVVFVTAVTNVLVQQVEGVLAGTPVHLAITAFAFAADHV